MAQNVQVCDVGCEIKEKLKRFRFRKEKNVAALLLKIDPKSQTVTVEEEYEDTSVEELQAELPEHQPRFLVLSYVRNHGDGRVSYPLCFIYICPSEKIRLDVSSESSARQRIHIEIQALFSSKDKRCKTELSMMYAGTRNSLQQELGLTKDFELRSTEDFTQEWLDEKLAFFR